MVQLVTQRTALVLYGVLLVLPTAVLGGLFWRQISKDQTTELEAVPRDVADAARRLSDGLREAVDTLVSSESKRVFFEYKRQYYPPRMLMGQIDFMRSPLSELPRPTGILGWFQARPRDNGPEIQIGRVVDPSSAQALHDEVLYATQEFARLKVGESQLLHRMQRLPNFGRQSFSVPVMAINLSTEEDLNCLRDEATALRGLEAHEVEATVFDFELRFFRDGHGTPRIVASRVVNVDPIPDIKSLPPCFSTAKERARFLQGFFIDPQWLFVELPRALRGQVLDPSQELFGSWTGPLPSEIEFLSQEVRPMRVLGIQADEGDPSYGAMQVAVDAGRLRERQRSQNLHLIGVAAMLVISLGTGLVLLIRSVQRDLEAARRTENFVSAVTHELRTPLAAIRLYGEMLHDGWVDKPEKRAEYYRRIVREAQRLETLVENVLEKGRLTTQERPVEPGDLNRGHRGDRAVAPPLARTRRAWPTLRFELQDDLPVVMLVTEGVRSIVTNLVENARKYAPVAAGGEPIVVRTRREGGAVLLEVLDRGDRGSRRPSAAGSSRPSTAWATSAPARRVARGSGCTSSLCTSTRWAARSRCAGARAAAPSSASRSRSTRGRAEGAGRGIARRSQYRARLRSAGTTTLRVSRGCWTSRGRAASTRSCPPRSARRSRTTGCAGTRG